jgi:hypothetical protein
MKQTLRLLGWAALACVLAAVGFAALVYGSAAWLGGQADPDAALRMRGALMVYFLVVLVKGLIPAVFGAVALWPLVDWRGRLSRRGRRGVVGALVIAATLSSVVVAGLLMPRAWHGLPAVAFRGPANFVQSAAELAAGVALALGLARILLGLRGGVPAAATMRREPSPLGAGSIES